MPIDSHLPQADPFSLVPTFKQLLADLAVTGTSPLSVKEGLKGNHTVGISRELVSAPPPPMTSEMRGNGGGAKSGAIGVVFLLILLLRYRYQQFYKCGTVHIQ